MRDSLHVSSTKGQCSDARPGPWELVADRYSTDVQLIYISKNPRWTEMVSHGEVIRAGYNQKMEYEPDDCQCIILGILPDELTDPYTSIPWKLGIIIKSGQSGK